MGFVGLGDGMEVILSRATKGKENRHALKLFLYPSAALKGARKGGKSAENYGGGRWKGFFR